MFKLKYQVLSFALVLCAIAPMKSEAKGRRSGIELFVVQMNTGKFHRINNRMNTYPAEHAFHAAILPDSVANPTTDSEIEAMTRVTPKLEHFKGNTYRFFFVTAEQLVKGLEKAVKLKGKISKLHVNAHGMPGGNIIPRDFAQLQKDECSWMKGGLMKNDTDVYNSYYGISETPVPLAQIHQETVNYTNDTKSYAMTGAPTHIADCTVRLDFWQETAKTVKLSKLMAQNSLINFFTCHQSLGLKGEEFMQEFAELFYPTKSKLKGRVRGTDQYGANDWSVKGGMIGDDFVNTPENLESFIAWTTARRDIVMGGTFNVVTAEQNGSGVKLSAQPTTLMKLE